jgi:hypothetical protein
MKTRLLHTLYLAPAVVLLLMWIVAVPGLIERHNSWEVLGIAVVIALVVTWCITLFVHAVRRDKP